MAAVGVLDLEALDQGVADGRVLDDLAHVVEVGLGVQRLDDAFESLPIVGRTEIVETCCGAGAVLQLVGVERHRPNLSRTARRRAARMDARSSGVTFVVSERQLRMNVVERHDPRRRCRRRFGAHAAQDDRAVAVAGGVEPIRDPWVTVTQHHPHQAVGIHHGLMGVQAGLVAPVMDGLPPRVADGEAPVDAFGRFHFDDERLVGAQLPPADHRPVLRRRTDIGAVDRRQEAVRRRRGTELQKERQVVLDEVAEGDQLPRHRHVRIDRRALGLHRIAEPLDVQRRRHLGIPVVEEVPHRQRGMVAFDPHPISRSPVCSEADSTTSKFPSASTSSSSTSSLAVAAMPFIVCSPT